MKPVFADSFFFFAILNPNDAAHRRAVDFSQRHDGPLVTTMEVLTELADGLARTPRRSVMRRVLDKLRGNAENVVVPASQELWDKALSLYETRPDKQWSLTDCVSFTVMTQLQMTEALTGDKHFEQAGFRALLKD